MTFGKNDNLDLENGEYINYLDDKKNFDIMFNALKICNFSEINQNVNF